jgi:Lung seven transmembrane receptor
MTHCRYTAGTPNGSRRCIYHFNDFRPITLRSKNSGALMSSSTSTAAATSVSLVLLIFLLFSSSLSFVSFVQAGFVDYSLILEPTDAEVHYNDGYIIAPGFIDLGSLKFAPISPTVGTYDGTAYDDDDLSGGSGDGDDDNRRDLRRHVAVVSHPKRQQFQPQPQPQGRSAAATSTFTVLDVVIFHLPQKCVHQREGCDWPQLGVGKHIPDGRKLLRWCCSEETVAYGMCRNDTMGRLLIDDTLFTGNHREVTIPDEGEVTETIKYGKMEETQSGTYVVLFANCNQHGREIYVNGETVWKSKHGYLPGELYGFMYFYVIVTVVYFALWTMYGYAMKINAAYRIEIEKWIMLAISLGLLEMIFRSLDYFIWNIHGYRSTFIIWIGVLTGVLKQGISRCLIVMVSLGWGVVRDTLGSTMRMIIVLGATYIAISAIRDLMIIFYLEDIGTISTSEENKMLSIVQILTLLISAIDVLFILWILDALNNTVIYLESMNQTRKLERYNKLRCIFMFSILFAAIWAVFTLVDSVNDEGLIAEEHAWAIDAATEVNYLFVLIGVALLWRPNPNAQEYAYVMELSGDGDNGGENEIELSGVVPSAADSDDGDDDDNNYNRNGQNGTKGYNNDHNDDMDGPDGRFEIS